MFWFASILSCWVWAGDCVGVLGNRACVSLLSELKRSIWAATEGEAMGNWFVL